MEHDSPRRLNLSLPHSAAQNPRTLRALEELGSTLQPDDRSRFQEEIRNQLPHFSGADVEGSSR